MYHYLLILTCIASAIHTTTAQRNTASSSLAQLQNCKTDLLFTDYFNVNEETDIAASERYWRSTGAPQCAYHHGQIGCEALYTNLSACSLSATPQACFCLTVADVSCPDLCRHNSDPSSYTRWILEHYCFGPQLTAAETCNNPAIQPKTQPHAFQSPLNITGEAYKSFWIDYDDLQLASHNSLFAWQWEVKYDPAGLPNATATYKCPTKAGQLGSFVVVNIVTVLASFIFGHRQVLKWLTCKMLGDMDSSTKRWFLSGAISAGLSIGANAINAKLIKQTQGFGSISITQLVLLWCARPRLSWLGGLLAIIGEDKMNYTALGASCTIAEGILQAVACFYMGRTAHWGVILGYLKEGHLDGIPGAHDAKLMYAGSLLWLITIAFVFLPWGFLVWPNSEEKDADLSSLLGIAFCCCMIVPLIGQWLFWAGFIGLAGDRYCPPNIIHITTVWSFFSIFATLCCLLSLPQERALQTGLVYKDVRNRINFLCKDLLEVNDTLTDQTLDYRVEFLHRTVRRDFLIEKDMHQNLVQRATDNNTAKWNTNQALCLVELARAKSLPPRSNIQKRLNVLFSLVDALMFYAHEVEIEEKEPQTRILEQLDRIMSDYAEDSMVFHWTNARGPPSGSNFDEYNYNSFLALTIQNRLHLYVKEKLDKTPNLLHSKRGHPPLDYALRPNIVTPTKLPQSVEFVDFDMVCLLLDKGAKPNEKVSVYGNITVWALFLLSCYEKKDTQNVEAKDIWFKVAELMIRKGADRKLKLETTRREKVVISSEAERSELMKTAKYRTSVSRGGGMVEKDTLVVLTAVGILREIFGDSKMAEVEAIEPEVTGWSVWNWIHWT